MDRMRKELEMQLQIIDYERKKLHDESLRIFDDMVFWGNKEAAIKMMLKRCKSG